MRIAITGSSGLAKTIKDMFEATPHAGKTFEVVPIRCEDITSNGVNCWIFNGHSPCDVLLNFAHQDQAEILSIAHESWLNEGSKMIINFSSRASQPNISKGYKYASEKAQLNHLANNLTYNSKKKYKMTTINLGLIEHDDLPSLKRNDIAHLVYKLVTAYPSIEFPEITMQHRANYMEVQE
jgi:hypothetical protein